VVIGNPPYIRQEEFSGLKHYLLTAFPETGAGTADLFVYFVELSMRLLKQEGEFAFIIPNKWMRAGYGKKLREFVAKKKINYLIDFGDLPVFEEATTYPNIVLMTKSEQIPEFLACTVTTLDFQSGMGAYLEENKIKVKLGELSPEGWTLSDSTVQALLSKIKSKGVPLGEYVNQKIFYGIKTGYNEAFVIDRETRDRLIDEDPNSAKVIKPFLAGRDIKRYQTPSADKFLILFPKGFTIKRNLPIDDPNHMVAESPPRYGDMPFDEAWEWLKSSYPAIAEHLRPFKAQAMKRTDKGDFWWELRACDYYDEFEKPKIVYPNICKRPEFTYDAEKFYTNQKCFIITEFTPTLLGLLNSSLFFFLFRSILPKLRGDFYEPSYVYFKEFPIIEKEDEEVSRLVKECLDRKKQNPSADTTDLENQIDQLVYELYGLTEDEIRIVEGESVN
jgi:type II restriction/modification system DNA methylase subunit YeeA